MRKDWYKVATFNAYFNPSESDKQSIRNYMTNTMKLSTNLVNLLMKNSTEENWPKGLKTQELREKNKDMIKQMKGN